ncbi:MAG TPA: glycosyltransferase [Candidatus Omnitrophica bacterium]|nr:glycosyltransferase [Candidatus Omnitrophota bacterium]
MVLEKDMSKIKVLHIITRLDKGGSAENTLLTVSLLNKEEFKVTLISGHTNDPDKEIASFITQKNLDYFLMPELVRKISPLKDIKAFFKIYHFIKKQGFDIVHTHTSKAGMLGRWAAKLAGVKIIVHTPHGHIFYGYFGWFKTKLFIYLERLTGPLTDKIITLTQRGKEEHVKYRIARPDKFVPIYSGIDVGKFVDFHADAVKEKEKLNIPLDVPVIGTVTRLAPVKGNQYLIASLPEVVKLFPTLKVLIVGDGSERGKLERYVKKLSLLENVIFLGICKDVRGILNTFDIFVLPSLNEGMGRCMLEAQALGVPVVATKVGGIPEVVRDSIGGILVPPRNPEAMAEAIINLLKNKSLRDNMSEEAKRWVGHRFSAGAMVEKISDLYKELIGAM